MIIHSNRYVNDEKIMTNIIVFYLPNLSAKNYREFVYSFTVRQIFNGNIDLCVFGEMNETAISTGKKMQWKVSREEIKFEEVNN